jgi:hypothetical protein
MTSEVESRMVSRRMILPLLGLGAEAGFALRSTAAEAQISGVESGVNIASKSVTNAAAARLQQNSRHRASLRKARLHKANQQGKSSRVA